MLELYLTGGAELDDFLTWQEKNIDVASASMMRRKQPDVERMERRWRELAPVRARMTGLPAAVTMAANQ